LLRRNDGSGGDDANAEWPRDYYVDFLALAAVFPVELEDVQILIVNLNDNSAFNIQQGFTHLRKPNSKYVDPKTGAWTGRDVILTLQNGHFTLLKPTGESILDHPIDTILASARERGDSIDKFHD